MTAKRVKPGLQAEGITQSWAHSITNCIEVIMGRRGGKVDQAKVTALKVSAGPTAAQFNAVVDDLTSLKARFNELLEQVQG